MTIGSIGSLAGLAGQLFGGNNAGSVGLSPQQAALADYTTQQGLVKSQFGFGQTGTGMSTMATQAAGGAQMAGAEAAAGMSDFNTAIANAQSSDQGSLAGLLGGLTGGTQSQSGSGSSTALNTGGGTQNQSDVSG